MQRDSQKAFQSTHRHYLPWIYCNVSNTHCTVVLWLKCGIFALNYIKVVKVYNYCKYVWLSYSMRAFILNVFHTNRLPKNYMVIFYHGIEVLYVWI